MNARDPVAVIGLGAMGFPIARCRLAAGFPLTVYNRTTSRAHALVAAGAALAGSPAEAAARGRVVISMVSDERAVDAVVNGPRGLLTGMRPGAVHVGMSTVDPDTSRQLAEMHGAHGSHYVAAPVFGRPETAQQAKLLAIAAGPPPSLRATLPSRLASVLGIPLPRVRPPRARGAVIPRRMLLL